MKKKLLLVFAVIIFLCIGPIFFITFHGQLSISIEQNIVKDFASSSIEYGPIVASGGNDSNYIRALTVNDQYYESTPALAKTLDFINIYEGRIDSIEYGFYGLGGSGIVKVYNGSTWQNLETITAENWYNGTYDLTSYIEENLTVALTGYCSCDYLEIKFYITEMEWHELPSAQLLFDTPKWNIIASAIILFVVPLFMGSFDAFLILLGLILIPTSTLFLVKGGKDEMSSDKFFYCCVAFIFGWALLIGGIMP